MLNGEIDFILKSVVNNIKEFCTPITQHFQTPTYDYIKTIRNLRGSTGPKKSMHELQILIKEEIPEFDRPGLQLSLIHI